jgi:hypothetical protein
VVIILRDGAEHFLDDGRGKAIRTAIGNHAKMVDLGGDGEAIVSVSAIAQILGDEQFEEAYKRRVKPIEPVAIPKPIYEVAQKPVPEGYTRHENGGLTRPETAWMRESFGDWGKRNGKFEAGSGKKLLAYPRSAGEFGEWQAGTWPNGGEDGR